jgi:putative ABC transport system permease protein
MMHEQTIMDTRSRFGWLARDLRGAIRSQLATPGLTIAIVLTLALGVAASLATFALLNGLLLRVIGGVERPHELVRIAALTEQGDLLRVTSAMGRSLGELPAFAGVCALNTPGGVVAVNDRVTFEGILHFSGDCFNVLGVKPALGRLLTADDDQRRAPVAVVTYRFWEQALGSAPDVVGRTIAIDGAPFTIVGVMDPAFRGLSTAFPSSIAIPALTTRPGSDLYWSDIIGRLAPGVPIPQARIQVETAWPELKRIALSTARMTATTRQRLEASRAFVGDMRTGIESVLRPRFEQPLLLTFGLSLLMLAICGANVANLLVARTVARQRDRAMRSALGASPLAVWWQATLEAIIPILAGCALALPAAHFLTIALLDTMRVSYLELDPASPWDMNVVLFVTAAVGLILVGVSVAHAAHLRGQESLVDMLRASTVNTSGRSRRIRRLLVAGQIALTVMLVGGAGGFSRTLAQHYAEDAGFSASVLATLLMPVPGGSAPALNGAYYEDLLARIEAIPGVRAASLSTWMPLGAAFKDTVQEVPASPGSPASAAIWSVGDRFFDAVGIDLVEGHTFRRAHRAAGGQPAAAATAILSKSLAEQMFPGTSAVGRRVRVGAAPQGQDLIVVGVARDARLGRPQDAEHAVLYLNFWDSPDDSPYLLVRSHDRPELLSNAVRDALREDGRQFPLWMRTMTTQWEVALMQERLLAGTSIVFAIVALLITAVGLYGLLSHYVSSRRRELGIRMAIGARPGGIARLLMGEVAVLFLAGALAGCLALFAVGQILAGLIVGAARVDPALLATTLSVVLVVAVVSLWFPFRRALSVDPLIALRSE